mgnify:FL=1
MTYPPSQGQLMERSFSTELAELQQQFEEHDVLMSGNVEEDPPDGPESEIPGQFSTLGEITKV